MFHCARRFTMECAHFLPEHDGKCRVLHGHSYKVDLHLRVAAVAAEGPKRGMVKDFSDIDSAFEEAVFKALDHQVINETTWWKMYGGGEPPTAEHLARAIHVCLRDRLPTMWKVEVWETERGRAAYDGP